MAEKFGFFFVRFNALSESLLRVVCHILLLFCLKKVVKKFGSSAMLVYFCTRFRERNPGARDQRENYINVEDRKRKVLCRAFII